MEQKYPYEKIIAIDPGISGGIAVCTTFDLKVTSLVSMPETPLDIVEFLRPYSGGNAVCYLEKVFGKTGQSASASFTFGKNYGNIETALIALEIPTEIVTPQKWQKFLQLGNKGDLKEHEWKRALKIRAQQLFPYLKKITLKTADALLILRYAMLQENVWIIK